MRMHYAFKWSGLFFVPGGLAAASSNGIACLLATAKSIHAGRP